MSYCNRSERSFDGQSDLTLTYNDCEDYPNDKVHYQCESKSSLRALSTPHVFSKLSVPRRLACFKTALRVLVPSFLQRGMQQHVIEAKTHPTAYLDGMRGLAAFAVFLCHLTYGTWDTSHVYGAGEMRQNTYMLQLPIIRLIYAGPPMVAIFFVISGYALSYKPVKLMRAGKLEEFTMTMTSSVFRRAIRLFLPCFASTLLVSTLCQLGLYKQTEEFAKNMRAVSEDHAWTESSLLLQLTDWWRQMGHFVNAFDWSLYAGSIALDRHLWTIPAEYRCSMALFLTHLLTARMSGTLRIATLLGLICWGSNWNRWDLIPFWSGAFLAELDRIELSHAEEPDVSRVLVERRLSSYQALKERIRSVLYMLSFCVGMYLASFPDADGHRTPGYIYLNSLIPRYWTEKHRFWPTIAAVQIVWSVSRLEALKKVLTSCMIQYIGQISFPLYLMHGPVIHTLGYAVMQRVYPHKEVEDATRFIPGFIFSAAVTTIVVIWASDVFWRVIDTPSVEFARWLEKQMFVQ